MDSFVEKLPHIGIVAATAEGAALCYRILCLEAETITGRRSAQSEITLHSFPLHLYLDAIDRDDWKEVAILLSHSASKLAQVGADFIICPNNTLHKAFDLIESPIPWLHIVKPVVVEVRERRWHRVGILGTQTVMEGAIYSQKLRQAGIDIVVPKMDDRIRIQHVIRSELVAGLFTYKSRQFFQKVITGMAAEGAEAVILGCTELPLLISEDQSILPLLDSTRLLAQAALRYQIQTEKHQGERPHVDRQFMTVFTQGVMHSDRNRSLR